MGQGFQPVLGRERDDQGYDFVRRICENGSEYSPGPLRNLGAVFEGSNSRDLLHVLPPQPVDHSATTR